MLEFFLSAAQPVVRKGSVQHEAPKYVHCKVVQAARVSRGAAETP